MTCPDGRPLQASAEAATCVTGGRRAQAAVTKSAAISADTVRVMACEPPPNPPSPLIPPDMLSITTCVERCMPVMACLPGYARMPVPTPRHSARRGPRPARRAPRLGGHLDTLDNRRRSDSRPPSSAVTPASTRSTSSTAACPGTTATTRRTPRARPTPPAWPRPRPSTRCTRGRSASSRSRTPRTVTTA